MDNVDEKIGNPQKKRRKTLPARTPKERENQLISLAVDLAEKKLQDGTASSQIIALLLNLATTKAQLELEKMRSDVAVANAKVQMMESQETSKELYEKVLHAFKRYSGSDEEDDEDDDY